MTCLKSWKIRKKSIFCFSFTSGRERDIYSVRIALILTSRRRAFRGHGSSRVPSGVVRRRGNRRWDQTWRTWHIPDHIRCSRRRADRPRVPMQLQLVRVLISVPGGVGGWMSVLFQQTQSIKYPFYVSCDSEYLFPWSNMSVYFLRLCRALASRRRSSFFWVTLSRTEADRRSLEEMIFNPWIKLKLEGGHNPITAFQSSLCFRFMKL